MVQGISYLKPYLEFVKKNIKCEMDRTELLYLESTVRSLPEECKDKAIVNVGVSYGASAIALLVGMQEAEIIGTLFLIDLFKYADVGNDIKLEPIRERKDVSFSKDILGEAKKNVELFRNQAAVYFIKGFSDDANLETIGDISIIFIDADHSAHACLLDALKYSQKVVPGGSIIFHDYNNFESVRRAVLLFQGIRPDFRFKETYHSMAILVKAGD